MTRVVLKKLLPLPITIWVVTTIVFVVLRVLPGSAVDTIASKASPAIRGPRSLPRCTSTIRSFSSICPTSVR